MQEDFIEVKIDNSSYIGIRTLDAFGKVTYSDICN